MYDWLTDTDFLSIPLWNWLIAIAAGLAAMTAFRLALAVIRGRLAAIAARTHTRVDDALIEVLGSTSWVLLSLAAVFIGLATLGLSARWSAGIERLWFLLIATQVGMWVDRGIRVWTRDHLASRPDVNPVTTAILAIAARVLVWATVLLSVLSNLGIDITAMVTSLGIGGVAVALAVQTILSDLFASFSIGLDKPFEIGDFVVVGNTSGTVEHIGLKTTRIRNLSGEQVVWSNTELLKQTIQNFKRMQTRRVAFRFGVALHTDPELVERIDAAVRRIVEADADVRFDRSHFVSFGAYALEFEVVYFVQGPDFNRYMDIQQRINVGILRALRDLGVRIAMPEQQLRFADDAVAARLGGLMAETVRGERLEPAPGEATGRIGSRPAFGTRQ